MSFFLLCWIFLSALRLWGKRRTLDSAVPIIPLQLLRLDIVGPGDQAAQNPIQQHPGRYNPENSYRSPLHGLISRRDLARLSFASVHPKSAWVAISPSCPFGLGAKAIRPRCDNQRQNVLGEVPIVTSIPEPAGEQVSGATFWFVLCLLCALAGRRCISERTRNPGTYSRFIPAPAGGNTLKSARGSENAFSRRKFYRHWQA